MADSKSSGGKKKENHSSDEECVLGVFALEERELARHRLCLMKDGFEKYRFLYENYLHRHYLIVTLCGAVTLFGVVIAYLKFTEEKKNLLYSLQAVQSAFASLVSGGGLIANGSNLLKSKLKEESDVDPINEPTDTAITLCIERDLGGRLDEVTKKLRNKRDNLELAKSRQATWAVLASVLVLILVGVDFLGLLPDFYYMGIGSATLLILLGLCIMFQKTRQTLWVILIVVLFLILFEIYYYGLLPYLTYFGVGLEVVLIFGGLYFLCSTFILYTILSTPRDSLEYNRCSLYFVVVPCAFLVGLIDPDADLKNYAEKYAAYYVESLKLGKINSKEENSTMKHWIKDVCLSQDEKLEVLSLYCGLDPEMSQMKVEKFCKELKLVKSKSTEYTGNKESPTKPNFLESMDNIESNAMRVVIGKHFELGKLLVECLVTDNHKKDITKFSSFDTQILEDCLENKEGLSKYFEKNSSEILPDEAIIAAHDALKIYIIFNAIGEEKINRIKTFTASDIGRYTKYEIDEIIINAKHDQ